jgi:hypothetical protein
LLVLASVAFGSSCVMGGRSGPSRGCGLRDGDSTLVAGAPLYRECAVDTKATNVTRGAGPFFRPPGPPRDGCHSAELQFVVDTNGVPEQRTARILRTNDRSYADAVVATLSAWRYHPARIKDRPVRQIVTEREATSITVARGGAGSGTQGPSSVVPDC